MRRRNFLSAVAATVAVGGLTGCAGGGGPGSAADPAPIAADPAELERLAGAEGEVVWYSGGVLANEPVAKAFEARYGIPVQVSRFSSADMAQRVQADVRESGRIGSDLVSISDTALLAYLRSENLTRALPATDFPSYPEKFMLGDAGPTTQLAVAVIGINTEKLGGFTPKSWNDLLDPRLAGQIMVNDPRGTAAWAQVWYDLLNAPTLGEKYIKAIAAQNYQPVANALVGTEQLVAGQGGVLIATLPSLIQAQADKGAPVAYFFPTDPSPAACSAISITTSAEHPSAAMLFARWLVSEEGSQVVNAAEGTASPLGDLPGAVPLPVGVREAPDPNAVRSQLPHIVELLGFN